MLDALRPSTGALANLKELVSLRAERERDAAIAQRDAWLRQSDTNARAAEEARRALAKLAEAARPFLSEEGGTNEEKLALRALLEAEAPEPDDHCDDDYHYLSGLPRPGEPTTDPEDPS